MSDGRGLLNRKEGQHALVWDSNWSWYCACGRVWRAKMNDHGAVGLGTRGEYLAELESGRLPKVWK